MSAILKYLYFVDVWCFNYVFFNEFFYKHVFKYFDMFQKSVIFVFPSPYTSLQWLYWEPPAFNFFSQYCMWMGTPFLPKLPTATQIISQQNILYDDG